MPLTLLSLALGIPVLKPEHCAQLFINITDKKLDDTSSVYHPKPVGSRTRHPRFPERKRDLLVVSSTELLNYVSKGLQNKPWVLSVQIDLFLSLGLWCSSPRFSLHINMGIVLTDLLDQRAQRDNPPSLPPPSPPLPLLPLPMHTDIYNCYRP